MYKKEIVALYKAHKDEDGLPARESGRLPIIDIAGTPFFVEIRFNFLRPVSEYFLPEIRLDKCSRLTYDGLHQIFFYDKKNCEAVTDPAKASGNLLLAKIPANRFLDPYRHAENVGLPITGFLENGRLLMYREAETVPVSWETLYQAFNKLGPRESFEDLFNKANRNSMAKSPKQEKPKDTKPKKNRNGIR